MMNPVTGTRMGNGAWWLLSLGLALLVAGCGPSKMAQVQLQKARQAYAQAEADPNVKSFAPNYLSVAERAVQEAEQATSSSRMIHLSYLAETKSRIAVSVAQTKAAEKEIETLNEETARAMEQKRELDRQRELAKQQAEMEAEKARQEAEKARLTAAEEAERAAKAKEEAEKARLAAAAEAERAARAKAEAEQLTKELSDLQAKQTERGIVLTMGDVLFPFGKADLSSKADRSVEKLAEFLQKYPDRNVLIEGHTDSIGSEEYNLKLSEARSESVKAKLVADGIDGGRITTVGYGKKYPAYGNDTEANRALNRRVEVIILNEGVSAESQLRK